MFNGYSFVWVSPFRPNFKNQSLFSSFIEILKDFMWVQGYHTTTQRIPHQYLLIPHHYNTILAQNTILKSFFYIVEIFVIIYTYPK